MEIRLDTQAAALVLAFWLGAAIGLLYDCLRPVRRRSTRAGAAVLDALFALLAGTGAFFFAMGAENGRLGVWDLAMSLLGFSLYMHTVSDRVFGALDRIYSLLCRAVEKLKKIHEKIAKMAKILFHKVRECFIIKTDS